MNSFKRDTDESTVISSHTARELWRELDPKYGKIDVIKLIQLRRELNFNQHYSDTACYFTKLKKLRSTKIDNTFVICKYDV